MTSVVKKANWFVDLVVALGIVAVVLLMLYGYTRLWPPMVVIESGSMMHPADDFPEGLLCIPYGNVCTIDPGDLVLVKKVDDRDDVETWVAGGKSRYGSPGDVIVYFRGGNRATTPIIHRAMAYVEVRCDGAPVASTTGCGSGSVSYVVEGYGPFNDTAGIVIPELGLSEGRRFRPTLSGFITKGDNPQTNSVSDQASGLAPEPVSVGADGWVQGKARGELPWFGLIKLAVADYDNSCGANQCPPPAEWTRVVNAYAPKDLWVMLGLLLGLFIFVPVVTDGVREYHRRKNEEE
ncbi:MAG: S26 family signal peptidase [Methanobacteriota archaeon]